MKHIRKYTHLKEEKESPQEFGYLKTENGQVVLNISNGNDGTLTIILPQLHLSATNMDEITKQLIELGMPGIAEWLREVIKESENK